LDRASAAPPAETPKSEINILPPEKPAVPPTQTWESENFRPQRESRGDRPPREDRPRREDRPPREPRPVPEKFRYENPAFKRPAVEGSKLPDSAPPAPTEGAPKKSGGLFGWVKGIFGGKKEPAASNEGAPATGREGEPRGDRQHRHHRGGGRGGRGGQFREQGGEGRGQGGGGDGGGGDGHRRRRHHRGGRGRGGHYRGEGRSDYRGSEGRSEPPAGGPPT
jgi:hypothetical protein